MSTKELDKINWEKDNKKKYTIWLRPSKIAKIQKLAKKYGVTQTHFVEKILDKYLEN